MIALVIVPAMKMVSLIVIACLLVCALWFAIGSMVSRLDAPELPTDDLDEAAAALLPRLNDPDYGTDDFERDLDARLLGFGPLENGLGRASLHPMDEPYPVPVIRPSRYDYDLDS